MDLKHIDVIFDKLRSVAIFREFKPDELVVLLQHSIVQKYMAETTIIKEGNYDQKLYVLLEGKVGVIKDGVEISLLDEPGEIFGEMCIVDGAPRSADVITCENTTCLVTDMSFLDKSEKTFSSLFYRLVAEALSRRLRKSDKNVTRLMKSHT